MSSNEALIHLSDVKKVFYTDEVETHALSGIHLDIKKGEYLSIAGPSGATSATGTTGRPAARRDRAAESPQTWLD